ncbi:MAG: SurA N-terminal domain-containing protein [Treponema sp.]|jgi:parvulin-like peptidyl-prolyl isomerase|nr:SurA N-terminal domain-containing protein [Treponema sp.]
MALKEKKAAEKKNDSVTEEFIHRFKTRPGIFIGTVIVLIIVIIAFVFVPAITPSADMGRNVDLVFGYYGKTPISYVPGGYLAQVYENIARSQQNSGQDINNFFMNYQMWRAAFEQTVVHTAILEEMRKANYITPDSVVDKEVASLPIFQENGRFSSLKYRQMDGNTRETLWKEMQEEIISSRYMEDMANLKISSKEAPFVRAMASPERSFDMVSFSLSNYPDSETIAFANANPSLFKSIHLSKITMKSEKEVQQVMQNIKDGIATFEDSAKTQSQDTATAEKGGDMGVKMVFELQSDIPDENIRNTVLDIAKGSFSEVIKIGEMWAFFRAEDESKSADVTDEETLRKIRSYIMDFERGRVEDYFIKEAESFAALSKANGFDAALEEQSLERKHFGPTPINFGGEQLFPPLDSSVSELSGAVSNENFWQTAFSTPLNTASNPFVIGNNVLVLYPTEEKPADETNAGYIETAYSSYWLSYNMEQKIRSFFTTSAKLKDNFMDVYFKYLQPQSPTDAAE